MKTIFIFPVFRGYLGAIYIKWHSKYTGREGFVLKG